MTSEWGLDLRHFWEAGRAAITLSGSGVTQELLLEGQKFDAASQHMREIIYRDLQQRSTAACGCVKRRLG